MTERMAHPRIWVALDESPRGTAALTAAAALAAELDAELAGLFVEDVNLQHLIGLPFAREFSALTGAGRSLSQADVERTWRREAAILQRLLVGAAEPLRLRWSFKVARGRVSAEVNALAQALDLVVLGRRSGVILQAVALAASHPARTPRKAGPVLVLWEEGAAASRSLELGALLARRDGAELVLLVGADSEMACRAACDAARAALGARGRALRCDCLAALDGPSLIGAARREAAACLLLPERERFLSQAGFERMLDGIDCPIVLTR